MGDWGAWPRPGPQPLRYHSPPFLRHPDCWPSSLSLPRGAPSGPLQLTKEAPGWIWGHRRHQGRPIPLEKLVGIS